MCSLLPPRHTQTVTTAHSNVVERLNQNSIVRLIVTQKHTYAKQVQISSSYNHMLNVISVAFSPPPPKSQLYSLTIRDTLNSSSSNHFPLSVALWFDFLAHTQNLDPHTHTHMHISPCPDTSTPLYPPLRLGATRLIHLHSLRGERGATSGANMEGMRVEKESFGVSCNFTEALLYPKTVTIRHCSQR